MGYDLIKEKAKYTLRLKDSKNKYYDNLFLKNKLQQNNS